MNNFNMNDSRNRRNLLNWSGFFPFHTVTNYSSDASKMKMDMKDTFGDGLYINNLHLIPDPLKKNLADSIITGEVKTKTNMASETKTFIRQPNKDQTKPKIEENNTTDHRPDFYPSLASISSFFSGVFSFVSGAMFHKRANSSAPYYECFEQNFDEMTPSLHAWQNAKPEDQNKNRRAHKFIISTNEPTNTDSLTMNSNFSTTAAHCDDKLNQFHLILTNQSTLCRRDPLKEFFANSSIEDCFEDAFTPEDFEGLSDDDYLEYYGPFSHQNPELVISDAPRIKTEHLPLTEHVEVTTTLPNVIENGNEVNSYKLNNVNTYSDKKNEIVSSCEDKMNNSKALLQKTQRNKQYTDNNSTVATQPKEQHSEPISIPNVNNKSTIVNKQKINNAAEDFSSKKLFVEDIVKDISKDNNQYPDSSPDYLDPCNYFDEVSGRFYSTSATDSEDSFQIVFTDSPKSCRRENLSDCESEDSFIVFEDSPDSCYLSNDVFGGKLNSHEDDDSGSDNFEESDDSDSEIDSGCDSYQPTCKLSHSLTRTIGDLTDDALYEVDMDEVDCTATFKEDKPFENITNAVKLQEISGEIESKQRGMLVDEKRKLEKQKQPKKNVHFSPHPPKVHVMRVWTFAARQARISHWERYALDRDRFKRRIADVDMAVSWVLKPQHRARVMFQRFMPWWNAEKRKELAEKKKKEEEEKNTQVNGELNDKSDTNVVTETDVNNIKHAGSDVPNKKDCKKILNGYSDSEGQIKKNSTNVICGTDVALRGNNGIIYKNESHKELKDNLIVLTDHKINDLKFGYRDKDIDVTAT